MTPSEIFLGVVIYIEYLNVFANSVDQWIVQLIWPLLRSLNVEKAKKGGFEFREIVKEVKKGVLNKLNIFFSGCFLGLLSIDL